MIERFTDLAANERAFLAWVRTAVAIIAFGFLVEKFELFLHYLARVRTGQAPDAVKPLAPHSIDAAQTVGLLLVGLGIVMIAIAAIRFLTLRRRIRAEERIEAVPITMDIFLSILLILILTFLAIYFVHTFGSMILR
ncbi:MAG: DUF202 domain-containing protein [Pseudomonadota bacterium]